MMAVKYLVTAFDLQEPVERETYFLAVQLMQRMEAAGYEDVRIERVEVREKRYLGDNEEYPDAVLEAMGEAYERLGYDGEVELIEKELESRAIERNNG